MSDPRPFELGQAISLDALTRMGSEIGVRTHQRGGASLLQQRGNGTVALRRPRGLQPGERRGSGGQSCPFDITLARNESDELVATFRAGQVNQLLPDNYLSGVVVADTGTVYLVLTVTVESGVVVGATFSAEEEPPDAIAPMAGMPPTEFAILIGIVVDGTATKVWGCGNVQALPVEAWRLEKETPVPGQLPYDVYYTWSLDAI